MASVHRSARPSMGGRRVAELREAGRELHRVERLVRQRVARDPLHRGRDRPPAAHATLEVLAARPRTQRPSPRAPRWTSSASRSVAGQPRLSSSASSAASASWSRPVLDRAKHRCAAIVRARRGWDRLQRQPLLGPHNRELRRRAELRARAPARAVRRRRGASASAAALVPPRRAAASAAAWVTRSAWRARASVSTACWAMAWPAGSVLK
jgi:hypothetical protein